MHAFSSLFHQTLTESASTRDGDLILAKFTRVDCMYFFYFDADMYQKVRFYTICNCLHYTNT